ncbi:hypothetical protein GQ43DRAFT_377938 [Delitschia confertaspora ATCC 74209]|uniref:Uncharacterized protein n=1 Tax=Delitschia confertaspora ATCC 74209 TaxID=1513339 RepID=A0A9P4JG27_9PLEO|nr:hypothetical protein GQ43DRAFT_377938 [Delitschia confertaspora ATCC 74209]
MVFMKMHCDPEDEKATIGVRMTTSKPTLSSSDLKSTTSTEPVLEIQIHARCLSSVYPSRPITFCTSNSIFDTHKPDFGHMDNLALGMLGPGLVCSDRKSGNPKAISLGFFKVHRARQDGDDALNLYDRPDAHFITVPSQDSGEEVVVTHTLSSERLFAYAEGITPEEVKVGEKYDITLRRGYAGTMWWCWGDLEGCLKGKKLHAYSEGCLPTGYINKPSEAEIEKEGWVTGERTSELIFKIEEDGQSCQVEVVE